MQWKAIERIMKENDKYAQMLEEFDRTGVLSIDKIRRSFTIKNSTFSALKSRSKATGRPMSDIIDGLVEKSSS
ncbi:MAG: hypothetical protein NTU57_01890 [Candidatus Aenigmarchaeota archaeon]|nr:hypothetical protein [Candidatus Aenigmarchaeota archaeon]